jgi:sugar phosphate isomerase/epimerase
MAAIQTEVDTCVALGSEAISVHYLGDDALSTRAGYTATTSPAARALVKRQLDYAQAQNVALAIEPMEPDLLTCAAAAFPTMQLCLDPARVQMGWHSGALSLSEYYDGLEQRIGYVHLYDILDGHGHVPPGCPGANLTTRDWRWVIETLGDQKYRGLCALEIRCAESQPGG